MPRQKLSYRNSAVARHNHEASTHLFMPTDWFSHALEPRIIGYNTLTCKYPINFNSYNEDFARKFIDVLLHGLWRLFGYYLIRFKPYQRLILCNRLDISLRSS